MTEPHSWRYLIEQYLAGTCTREELDELLQKAADQNDLASLDAVLKSHWDALAPGGAGSVDGAGFPDPARDARWDEQFGAMVEAARQAAGPEQGGRPERTRKWVYWAAAAILILVFGSAGYYLFSDRTDRREAHVQRPAPRYENDLPPGSNGAVLTLAGGRRIVLDSAGNGVVAIQGKTRLINRNGQVIYEGRTATGQAATGQTLRGQTAASYNTLTTPKGRQYQLTLSDGSRVWLNAASSIHYPTAFSGDKREVEITGEAYFEIAPDPRKAFIVGVNGLKVDVLGTRFNVNAYADEAMVKTTLLAGAVKVSDGSEERLLRPGEQAGINKRGDIEVSDRVDVDQVTGWKDGYFAFDNTDLRTVMREIARWYDVDIVYAGTVPDRKFGGAISRNSNASQVLKVLEESKVYFRIEGKKIIVLP